MRDRPGVYTYALLYRGEEAGEARLKVEGSKASLEAQLLYPLRVEERWRTEWDPEGFSLYFSERVEGREARLFTVERLPEEGLVLVSQGKETLALPDLTPYHDPLSLLLALPGLDLPPGGVVAFPMPGGRVYVEALEAEEGRRRYRLRPGLTLAEVEEGLLVGVVQRLEGHLVEMRLKGVEALKRRRRWV